MTRRGDKQLYHDESSYSIRKYSVVKLGLPVTFYISFEEDRFQIIHLLNSSVADIHLLLSRSLSIQEQIRMLDDGSSSVLQGGELVNP